MGGGTKQKIKELTDTDNSMVIKGGRGWMEVKEGIKRKIVMEKYNKNKQLKKQKGSKTVIKA